MMLCKPSRLLSSLSNVGVHNNLSFALGLWGRGLDLKCSNVARQKAKVTNFPEISPGTHATCLCELGTCTTLFDTSNPTLQQPPSTYNSNGEMLACSVHAARLHGEYHCGTRTRANPRKHRVCQQSNLPILFKQKLLLLTQPLSALGHKYSSCQLPFHELFFYL